MPVSATGASASALVFLVVEDEFYVRHAVAEWLRQAGHTVIETASGEEAIALCKSSLRIDVVFTDINLIGVANGWDVAECFRVDRPDVPVLYTSADMREMTPRVNNA